MQALEMVGRFLTWTVNCTSETGRFLRHFDKINARCSLDAKSIFI